MRCSYSPTIVVLSCFLALYVLENQIPSFSSSCGRVGLALQVVPLKLPCSPISMYVGAFCRIFLQEADSRGREEWMLVPPKSLGVLGAIKMLNPTNRKFQT